MTKELWDGLVLDRDAVASLYHLLMHEDVGTYSPTEPAPWFAAKHAAEADGHHPLDDMLQDVLNLLPRPIVCGQLLMAGLKKLGAADSLGINEGHMRAMMLAWRRHQHFAPVLGENGEPAVRRLAGASWGGISVRLFVTDPTQGPVPIDTARLWVLENDAALPGLMARLSAALIVPDKKVVKLATQSEKQDASFEAKSE